MFLLECVMGYNIIGILINISSGPVAIPCILNENSSDDIIGIFGV